MLVVGIHGVPYRSWDDVAGNQKLGYCTHASILFPSWHRPYLALFEVSGQYEISRSYWWWQQILWDYANRLAATYPLPQREQYQEAARSFRIPYWDWAASPSMPNLTNTANVLINLPSGMCNCPNPLSGYSFHPLPSSTDFPPGDPVSALIFQHVFTGLPSIAFNLFMPFFHVSRADANRYSYQALTVLSGLQMPTVKVSLKCQINN